MNQPFGWEIEKSGVKTRLSQHTVLPVKADLLLGPDSSLEMDSGIDNQSYSPTEVYALTWHDDVSHIIYMLPCSAYFRHHICHLLSLDMFCNATCLVSIYIRELCSLMSFSQP